MIREKNDPSFTKNFRLNYFYISKIIIVCDFFFFFFLFDWELS